MSATSSIGVDTGSVSGTGEGGGYQVTVGHGLMDTVATSLGPQVLRVLVVYPAAMAVQAQRVAGVLRDNGRQVHLALVPEAEGAKTAQVAAELWSVLGIAGFTRTDAVVGLGGGTVTDLAGFVAATWLRGVPVVQVPTTLLGMVDAAVGGKTGINTPEGKNLVGAFHEPVAVICDLDTLATLPEADVAAGMAEVVKCGFVSDPAILELVEHDPAEAVAVDGPVLRELVERAVRVKARVVSADLREASLREILNYGHTFGHAVEQVEDYRWRHGDAVSVGMTYAAELASRAGLLAPEVVQRHRSLLSSLGLPTSYAAARGDRWDALLAAMRRDKKARGALLRFVVLRDVGQPERLEGPPEQLLRDAYQAVAG